MLKEHIAENLEQTFSDFGFVEPNITQLKNACGVSLRTLYKYYPSKEEMIVAALEHRHQRYLEFLLDNSPKDGADAIAHIFNRLQEWMKSYAPNGCMSSNAIAAFPEHDVITQVVRDHKESVREFLGKQSLCENLASELFLLHEGAACAWPVLGSKSIDAAQLAALKILKEN